MITRVISVNISEKKGTVKRPADRAVVTPDGIAGDAHAGPWIRQVSLLSAESIESFGATTGRSFFYGEFAENITTHGIDLNNVRLLDRFQIESVLLEITQIGKACHGDGCAIYSQIGSCIMPRQGVFCRIVEGGVIEAGMKIQHIPKQMRALVITISDRAYAGIYQDKSGPLAIEKIRDFVGNLGYPSQVDYFLIPDEAEMIREKMLAACTAGYDVVFTTGGTGIGPRDNTPEITRAIIGKEIPGIMESIRMKYGQDKPGALLSRAVAGVLHNTLIFNIPGSVKAVEEYTGEIFKNLKHMIFMLHSIDIH